MGKLGFSRCYRVASEPPSEFRRAALKRTAVANGCASKVLSHDSVVASRVASPPGTAPRVAAAERTEPNAECRDGTRVEAFVNSFAERYVTLRTVISHIVRAGETGVIKTRETAAAGANLAIIPTNRARVGFFQQPVANSARTKVLYNTITWTVRLYPFGANTNLPADGAGPGPVPVRLSVCLSWECVCPSEPIGLNKLGATC